MLKTSHNKQKMSIYLLVKPKHGPSPKAQEPPFVLKPVGEANHFAACRGHGNVQPSNGSVADFVGFVFGL
jgi:hypothetical protein